MGAIFKREFKSYFRSSIGYIFLAVMFFFSAYFFVLMLQSKVSEISFVFSTIQSVMIMVIPILTMRLMSEEKKQRTDQLLLTAPVNLCGVVLGKFFAAFMVFLIGISPTILYQIILATFAKPNWNIFVGNFLALALLGSAMIAIGLLVSSMTESQVTSAIVTLAINIFILALWNSVIAAIPEQFKIISDFLISLSFINRYNDLVSGLLDISHIIFFISIAVVFNFLTIRVLEKKRWS